MNNIEHENFDVIKLKGLSIEELIGTYKNFNSSEILNLIIKKTEKLAYKIAWEFRNKELEQKDLHQVAFTGLLVAINRFDPKMNSKFSTFAVYCIRGEILHFIRDSKLIKIPRWVWELNKLFSEFVKNFEITSNRYPTIKEISAGINISVEGINEFLKAREVAFYKFMPIDESEGNDTDSNYSFDKSLIKSQKYKSFDLVMEDKILLWDAIKKLCDLNKKIVVLSYFLGFSQKEIGEKIGISQKSVSRKLEESIRTLKEYYAGN